MSPVTWDDVADRARQLALRARLDARGMDERRAALSRSALVWWSGEAAAAYQHRVQERVNALADLGAELEALARTADGLAEAATARARADAAAAGAGGPG